MRNHVFETCLMGFCVVAVTLFTGDAALAACPESETPAIHFVYPEDGATDVPSDARIWLRTDGTATVSLNGVQLDGGDPGVFAADTPYVLEIVVDNGGESLIRTTRFTSTGEEAAVPQPPVITGIDVYTDNTHLSAGCLSDHRRRCYDVGEDTHYAANVGGSDAFYWRVEGAGTENFVRGECDPAVYVPRDRVGEELCMTVTAISVTGAESEPVETCNAPSEGTQDLGPQCSSHNRAPTDTLPVAATLALLPFGLLFTSRKRRVTSTSRM